MRHPVPSLILISLLSAILWRAEIELRFGWDGLAWIADNYYSAPAICLLFSIWLYFTPCSSRAEAIGRSAFAFFGGLVGYMIYQGCFSVIFGRFGSMFSPFGVIALGIIFVIVPLAICAVAYWSTPNFQKRYFLLTPLLFAAAFPIACFFLWLTDHTDESDMIHAIKSGFVFPFLLIAAGLPFLRARPKETETPPAQPALG